MIGRLLCGVNRFRLRSGVVAAARSAYRHGRHASAQVGPRGEEEGHISDTKGFPDMLDHVVFERLGTSYAFDKDAGPVDGGTV